MAVSFEKKNILIIGIVVSFTIIIIRLFQIQIIDEEYRINADNNALKYETQYPARGRILDRNNVVLVGNKITYDIMVTPIEVEKFDTLAFCNIFSLDTSFVKEKFREFKLYKKKIGYRTLVFLKQVSSEQYNIFVEKELNFHGFTGTPRTTRTYPNNIGGNLLGYVSEVDADYLKNNPIYKSGDYAGHTGIEEAYEDLLRGEKGYSIYLRDARNKIQGKYDHGAHDKIAVAGTDVISTIDGQLQSYGELLMNNKVGSLVAIEPSTGEILAMISSPGVETSKLAEINKYYSEIINDPYKPMFNRTVMSPQPPGSVFKLINALIGLQEDVVTTDTRYPCHQGYTAGKVKVGCHNHPSPLNFYQSIMMSCNSYYCYLFRSILDNPKYDNIDQSFTKWREYVESFGFGKKLGSDIPSEQAGFIPSSETYNKLYRKGGWKSLTVISLAIGQGEIGTTPLHLANFAATIANRGYYYTPHMIKETENHPINSKFKEKHYTLIDTTYFSEIIKGMYMAVQGGAGSGATAINAFVPGLEICGKTGTAQNPHGDNHSVFICFAPKDNPKIAVVAYIENGGYGATWAVPIASLIVEKYLNKEITPERVWLEQKMFNSDLLYKVNQKKYRKK